MAGVRLLLCNEVMFWQVRIDLSRHRLYRYLRADPHPDPLLRTTEWRDPSLRYPVYLRTGCERWHGGLTTDLELVHRRGLRIVAPESPLLAGADLSKGDIVPLPDAQLWDGAPVKGWVDGAPQIDFGDSPPWRHEVVGYTPAKPGKGEPVDKPAIGLWMVLRHREDSGTVIHGGTMGWCGLHAMHPGGPYSELTQSLILRMLNVLVNDDWPFAEGAG